MSAKFDLSIDFSEGHFNVDGVNKLFFSKMKKENFETDVSDIGLLGAGRGWNFSSPFFTKFPI